MAARVLVAGAAHGDLTALRERVAALNASAHGPFTGVLCCGELLGPGGEHDGTLAEGMPLPTFCLLGANAPPGQGAAAAELAPNLHFLGACGVRALPALGGLRVAFISGPGGQAAGDDAWQPTPAALEELLAQQKRPSDIDVLLSCAWPEGVERHSGGELPPWDDKVTAATRSQAATQAVDALAPRYAFAGGADVFWQRAPFANGLVDGAATVMTRFIALANVRPSSAPKDKTRKWLHALQLEPLSAKPDPLPDPLPVGYTASPFGNDAAGLDATRDVQAASGGLTQDKVQALLKEAEAAASQHFFERDASSSSSAAGSFAGGRRKRRRTRFNVAPRADCWYCLASPGCETHLIVSVDEDVYVTLPKGGVSAQHCQVIPVSHEASLSGLERDVMEQVERYKRRLVRFYASFGCAALFHERNLRFEKALQQHAFLEAIPLPATLTAVGAEGVIRDQAAREGFKFAPAPGGLLGLGDSTADCEEYLYVEIAGLNGGKDPEPMLFCVPPEMEDAARKGLPLHFGRQVACVVLDCMSRVDWKGCIVPREVEDQLASDFKAAFSAFDAQEGDAGGQEGTAPTAAAAAEAEAEAEAADADVDAEAANSAAP